MFYSNGAYSLFKVDTPIISGGSTPPFTNTKSILTDGVDDFVTMGNTINMSQDGSDAFSFSLWMKRTNGSGVQTFLGKNQTSGKGIRIYSVGTNVYMLIGTYSSACLFNSFNFTSLNNGSWHHIVWTYDGSSTQAGMKLYINDSLKTLGSGVTNTPINLQNTTMDFMIGASGTSSSYNLEYNGYMDEVSYFDSVLSASDVSTIYNSGVPNDISSFNPLGWWRMGDGDTSPTITDHGSGGNNGTMTNFTTFSNDVPPTFSKLSTLFDGVDDFVSMGNVLNMADDGTDAFSMSLWFKTTSTSTQMLMSKQINVFPYNGYNLYMSANRFKFSLGTLTASAYINGQTGLIGSMSDGNWHHLTLTYNGSQDISGFTLYYDNSNIALYTIANNTPNSVGNSADFLIGARGTGASSALFFSGTIDEASYFNTELSASDVNTIYNNGIPNDISGIGGLLSFWRMGDNDTYPTINDVIGTNDGTMNNMSSANFVANVPT